MKQLLPLVGKKVIKVVTGVRRCGKSTMMEILRDVLLTQGVAKSQIININLEDYDNLELRDPRKLYDYVNARIATGKTTYIFLDEIQHVKEYADVVDALFMKPDTDLYVTGSNAYLLSSEIATLLSGRYIEIKMLPLSFAEYVSALGDEKDLGRKYAAYISQSSFPYALDLRDSTTAQHEYLSGIYSTVVLKDIMQRRNISDAMMLESIIRFVMDNIGNTLSTKKIADTMTSVGRKIDTKTVEKYLTALQESFIVYKAPRYNIRGRQLLKTMEKYYLVDVALRRVLLGARAADTGHILENVVYLELLRRTRRVYIGKMDEQEVDFVCEDDEGLSYYQVAATVREATTLASELAPFRNINDHFPKFLLTLDEEPEINHNGIRQLNVLQWLLQQPQ